MQILVSLNRTGLRPSKNSTGLLVVRKLTNYHGYGEKDNFSYMVNHMQNDQIGYKSLFGNEGCCEHRGRVQKFGRVAVNLLAPILLTIYYDLVRRNGTDKTPCKNRVQQTIN